MTADETRIRYIEKMGEVLGTQFYLLYQEVAWLYLKWTEFVELFGSKPTRVDLLNQSAPAFFRLIQDALWEDIVLHIARLTDVSKSLGTKSNLTICNLPHLITDPGTRAAVQSLVEVAKDKTDFCRDWRNRHIAHRDLDLALNKSAAPLAPTGKQQVREALNAIANVINALDSVYMNSSIYFDAMSSFGGAITLLHVLNDGVITRTKRRERLNQGEFSEEDHPRDI